MFHAYAQNCWFLLSIVSVDFFFFFFCFFFFFDEVNLISKCSRQNTRCLILLNKYVHPLYLSCQWNDIFSYNTHIIDELRLMSEIFSTKNYQASLYPNHRRLWNHLFVTDLFFAPILLIHQVYGNNSRRALHWLQSVSPLALQIAFISFTKFGLWR